MNQDYINELESKIRKYEEQLAKIAAPIIPSIVPNTVLIPITGILNEGRFERIRENILQYLQDSREVDTSIIDFTGITTSVNEDLDYYNLSQEIKQLAYSLKLMGVETYCVGFGPKLAQEIVNNGLDIDISAHSNFRTALQFLMKKKEIEFENTIKGK